MRNGQKGFSLIELLIVVAIILIIAAIAIPNLIRSRMAANEASAVAGLRTIFTAQATYSSSYGVGNAINLVSLGSPLPPAAPTYTCVQAGLLDPVLTTGIKSGYTWPGFINTTPAVVAVIPAGCVVGFQNWGINANPVTCDTSGHRDFYVNQTGVIYFGAAAACPIIDDTTGTPMGN